MTMSFVCDDAERNTAPPGSVHSVVLLPVWGKVNLTQG